MRTSILQNNKTPNPTVVLVSLASELKRALYVNLSARDGCAQFKLAPLKRV